MAANQDYDKALQELTEKINSLKNANIELEKSLILLNETTKKVAAADADLAKKTKANEDAVNKLTAAQKAELEVKRLATEEGRKELEAKTKLSIARKKAVADITEEITGAKAAAKAQRDFNKAHSEAININKQLEKTKLSEQLKKEKEALRLAALEQKKFNQAHAEAIKINNKLNSSTKKSSGLFKSMTKSIIAAGAAYFSLRAAFTVVKNGLKTIIDFEKGMSAVKAITNATATEFKLLQQNALKLGAGTAKSAIQISSLQKEFAKLGFSSSEIIAATEATVNLSIAAESDLAEAATVAASTIRGFGFAATETGRITDVMAKSFTTTGLNLEKFKVAMANAQVAAKATGQSFEFTTAALGTIIDTGTDASKAGTDLRAIFAKLAIAGISLEDAYSRVNSASNKVVAAQELVGDRVFSSLITLAEQTGKVDDLTEAYKNSSGAAKEMADIMADNLAGDVVLATSAWEGFILSLNSGEGTVSKILRGIVTKFTDFVTVITKLNEGESLRVQKLKEEMGYENRLAQIKKRSLEIIESRTEKEGKARSEVIQGLIDEAKSRADLRDAALKDNNDIITDLENRDLTEKNIWDRKKLAAAKNAEAQLIVSSQLAKETLSILENTLAAELDAEKAKQAAIEETERIRKAAIDEREAEAAEKLFKKNVEIGKKQAKVTEDFLNKKIKDNEDFIEKFEADELALTERERENLINQLDEEAKLKYEALNKELSEEEEVRKDGEARKRAIKVAAIEAAGEIVSDRLNTGIDEEFAKFQANQDAQKDVFQSRLDADLNAVNLAEEKGTLSKEAAENQRFKLENDFKKKTAALDLKTKQEAAKAEKKKALYDIFIATAVAIAKAAPVPPLMAFAAIIGGIQAAVVAARPVPKFEKGTNGQTRVAMDAIVGEKGSELVTTPQGAFLTPSTDTYMHLPKGSEVFRHDSPETQAALVGGMSEKHYNGLIASNKEIVKAINNQSRVTLNKDYTIIEKRNSRLKIKN